MKKSNQFPSSWFCGKKAVQIEEMAGAVFAKVTTGAPIFSSITPLSNDEEKLSVKADALRNFFKLREEFILTLIMFLV